METRFADIAPIEHRTLADAVTDRIRDAIVLGHLKPGQRLTESMLADYLEVSRSPVREALGRLRYLGLVEGSPSCYVWEPTPDDVDEIFTLRTALDCLADEWIVTRGNLADEDVDVLQAMVDGLREKLTAPESLTAMDVVQADEAFHRYLYHRSGHSRLIRLWQQTMSQRRTLMYLCLADAQLVETAMEVAAHNEALLSDLRSGNLERVRQRHCFAGERCTRQIKERLAGASLSDERKESL